MTLESQWMAQRAKGEATDWELRGKGSHCGSWSSRGAEVMP